jgi:hypothetical protein
MCKVYEEQVENPSDHLPITVRLQTNFHVPLITGLKGPNKIAWDRANPTEIQNQYTVSLDKAVLDNPVLENAHSLFCGAEENSNVIDTVI